jgi:SAM-dependent methyltransferase
MKLISYLHYFFYIAWHWNPLIALFIIYYEIVGERKYNINTIGADELKSLEEKGIDISHATMYMPVNYYILEHLMREIVKYASNKTFLDIGCGKGRPMIVAAYYGFEEIVGIDFSKEFCEDVTNAAALYKEKNPAVNFSIINNDAFYFEIPENVTAIFLFNPFDDVIMNGVISNILKSQQQNPRTIRVLYANPQYKSLFLNKEFKEIYHIKKLKYLEGAILEKG